MSYQREVDFAGYTESKQLPDLNEAGNRSITVLRAASIMPQGLQVLRMKSKR